MYYLEAGHEKHTRMRNALLLACAAHIIFAVAVTFDIDTSPSFNPQIEVTLATRSHSARAPDDARHIAQSNQEGSGSEADINAVTSSNNEWPMQEAAPQQAAPLETANDSPAGADLLSTAAAAPRRVDDERSEQEQRQNLTPGINPEVEPTQPTAGQPGSRSGRADTGLLRPPSCATPDVYRHP